MTPTAYLLLCPIAAALLSVALTPGTLALLRKWGHLRPNFEGQLLVHSGGLAFLPPLFLGAYLCPQPQPAASLVLLVGSGFALLGLADDLWGSRSVGGLGGHFRALFSGQVTTGVVKALGGAALALAAGFWWEGWAPREGGLPLSWAGRVLAMALTIALTANALNLLDLRPLRALKALIVLSLPVWAAGLASGTGGATTATLGALLGAMPAYWAAEAQRRTMLGDAGANMLGAVLGLAMAIVMPPAGQIAWILVLIALHVYSEQRPVSAFIECNAWLRAADAWGWRPSGGQE